MTLDEGAEGSWTVVLNTPPTASVAVVVGAAGSGVISVDEPNNDPATLTFTTANWDKPQTVKVTADEDDNVTDGSDTVSHSVTSTDTNYNHRDDSNEINRDVTVSVKDNDSARLTLSRTSLDVSEDASPVTVTEAFTVVLTGQPAGNVTVSITSSDIAKVPNPQDESFSSDNWATPQGVSLTIQTDTDSDDDTVTLMMTTTVENAADGAFNGLTASFTVNISDDDKAGIKLSAGAVTVLEGTTRTNAELAENNSAKWTVQLNTNPGAGNAVKVAITSSNPSAATVEPTEITFTTDGSETGAVTWDAPQDVIVTGVVDDDFLHNEVIFTHAVTEGTYAAANRTVTVTATDTATASIVLGNVQPGATDADPDTLFIDEGVTRYAYTVALSHRPTSRVRIAMPNPHPDKLTLSTSRLSFEPGGNDWSRPRNIYVDALPDENNENDTFDITHTATGGGYDNVASVLAITVEDSGKPGIKLSRTNLTLDEGAEGSWTVVLNTPPTASVAVVVGAAGSGVISVDEPNNDPATLTFTTANWDKPQTVKVTADEDDNVTDGSDTVSHSVTSTDTNYNHRDDSNEINRDVTVSVKDNDSARLTLSRTSLDVSEDASPVTVTEAFTVVLTGQPAGNVTVSITSSDIAKVPNPQDESFSSDNWATPQGVSLTIQTDTDSDDDTVTLMMTTTVENAADGAFNGLTASFTVNISDDDKAGIKLSAGAVTVREGTTRTNAGAENNSAKWTVQLNTNPGAGNAVKVAITSSNPSAATVEPTEITFTTDGSETGAVTWDAPQDVIVTGVVDDDFLHNEVIFTHAVTEGTYAAANRTVTVTATDTATASIVLGNVQPGATDADPDTLFIDEGVTRYAYTVALSHRPTSRVRIAMPNPHPDKLTLSTSRLSFEPGGNDWSRPRNIYVDALPDENNENDTFDITHTATGGGYDNVASVLAITVEDSGKPGIKLSRTNLTLDEGAEGSWTVVLNTPPTASVAVVVGAAGSGVISVDEPNNDPATLTFTTANWDKPQTVKVTADEDDNVTDGSDTVSHSVTSTDTNYNHRDDSNEINRDVTVSVKDNDSARLTLSRTSLDVSEDASPVTVTEAFTVVLTGQPAGNVTVSITSSDIAKVPNPQDESFSSDNWATPQGVSLTIQTDTDSDDDTVTLMMTTTVENAADGAFNGLTASFTVNISDDDKAGIKLSAGAVTVREGTTRTNAGAEDNSAKWTVQLNTNPGAGNAVKVAITSSNPSAATVEPTEITFTTDGSETGAVTWDAPQDVIVTGVVDDDFLHNEVIFTHAVTEGTYAAANRTVTVTATDTATASIVLGNVQPGATDADPDTLFIDEGVTRYAYTVALSHRPTSRVRIAMPNPHPDKLTLSTSRLSFEPGGNDWSRPRNIYVDALPDENNENDTFDITHTATGGGYDNVASVLAITVEDSGKPGIKLSRTNLTLDEGAEGSWTVVLNTPPTASVAVVVGAAGSGVISVDEPNNDPATLTFTTANWDKPQTVKVTADEDDNVTDGSDTVSHSVTSTDTNYNHRDDSNEINRDVTVSVKDNDSARLTLSRTSLDVSEDASPVTVTEAFTVVLTGQPAGNVTVSITSSDIAKVPNPQDESFSSDNWATPQGVSLTIQTDTDSDDDTVTLMMTTTVENAADGAFNGLTASFTVNISDDDKAGIKLSAGAVTVREGTTRTNAGAENNSAKWTVQLNTNPGAGNAVKVAITSSNPSAATVEPTEITFTTDGSETGAVTWDAPQDVIVTGVVNDDFLHNEVIFTHAVTEGTYAAANRTVTVTATDTATASIVLGNVQPGTPNMLSLEEGTTRYAYTVALSHRPTSRVRIAMPNPHPDKLTLSTSRLSFEPGGNDWSRPRNIYVDVIDDNVMDDTATPINITHTATGGGYDDVASVLAVTIIDNDVPGLKLSKTNATVTEGQTVTWEVSLFTEPVGGDVTVAVGAAGTDSGAILVTGGPLTFDADDWNKPQTVTVMAREDANLVGASAEVTHVASDADYDSISFTVPVTVNDDDSASLVLEGLTNGGLTVKEANNQVTATFMVKLSAEPLREVTVTVTKSGSDMVEIASGSESFTIQPNAFGTAREVTINVAADDDSNNESATITLTASGAEFAGKTATVSVSVIDDEVPGLRVSTNEVTISQEDGGTVTFMVQLNTQPTGDVTVTIESRDTGAVTVTEPANPATLTFTTADYNDNQPVTLTSVEDNDVGDESVDIVVSSSGANYGNLSTTVKANVTDDDEGNLVFDPAATDPGVTVTENSSATYTVRLQFGPNANVTVSLASDMPAVATVSPAKLTFTTGNWQQPQTVTVYGTEDMDAENGSTHIKNTATGGGYEITDTDATQMPVTVTDDDQPEIIVSTDKLTVNEGSDASFRVRLKTEPSGNVTVNVTGATTSLTIKSGASLTFTSGNYGTDQTVTLTGVEESAGTENVVDEEVTLTIESSGGDYQNTTDKMVVVSVDDNDTLTYSFAQDSYSGDEGGNVTVLLDLNIEPGEVKEFTLQVLHGGGASSADYDVENHPPDPESSKFQLTFAANEKRKAISVAITASDGLDPGESISFVVIDAVGVKAGSPSATEVKFVDTEPDNS